MGDDPLDWGKVCLHPAFTSGFGMELVVRRFVQDWLLPRYRFSAAFRLAYLKLNADPAQLPPKPPRALSAVFRLLRLNTDSSTRQSPARALGTATLLFVALTCILFLSEFEWPLSRSPAIEAGILLLPLAYFLLVVLRRFLEPSLLPALALPRVLGGMTLGYAALVIEGTEVATALWNNPLLLVLK
ncbi:MAG: hypothetical protein GX579_21150 [Chloroflexi bacterium]|nr:hypothetical protein [Chloroflexota bacterium]